MRLTDDTLVEPAEAAAAALAIPHTTVDFRNRFRAAVINTFAQAYKIGLTPNPCVVCNFEIKFGALLDYALAQGADKLATGHYVQVEGGRLLKGVDPKKDQSYFLYRLRQDKLSHLLFPLGKYTKDTVKEMARNLGLPQADTAESQDICFIPGGDCGAYVERVLGYKPESGPVVDTAGKTIGRHNGITRLTVGQRKGLGIPAGEPLYVLGIDAAKNEVTAGPRQDALKTKVSIDTITWVADAPPAGRLWAEAKIRYNGAALPVTVSLTGRDEAELVFDAPQFAPAPGQSAVIYDADVVLGGGVIREAH